MAIFKITFLVSIVSLGDAEIKIAITFVDGPAETGHISTNYTCSEKVHFLVPMYFYKLYIIPLAYGSLSCH